MVGVADMSQKNQQIDPAVVQSVLSNRGRAVYRNYVIQFPLQSGGKAGKGHNKTSTIQVVDPQCSVLMKQVRYTVNDAESRRKAIIKAMAFVDERAAQK